MDNIKLVEEVEYTGKFKEGDEVRVVGLTSRQNLPSDIIGREFIVKCVDERDKYLPYLVEFDGMTWFWFGEAELELVTKRNTDTDSLKLRTFEILSKSSDVKFIEKELRGYAEWAVNNYKYDKAVEIYELIKEWKKLS